MKNLKDFSNVFVSLMAEISCVKKLKNRLSDTFSSNGRMSGMTCSMHWNHLDATSIPCCPMICKYNLSASSSLPISSKTSEDFSNSKNKESFSQISSCSIQTWVMKIVIKVMFPTGKDFKSTPFTIGMSRNI